MGIFVRVGVFAWVTLFACVVDSIHGVLPLTGTTTAVAAACFSHRSSLIAFCLSFSLS